MADEKIEHKRGGYIKLQRGKEWKAFVYPPGATRHEMTIPNGPDRDAVIAEAIKLLDDWPT